jgi:tetratricopeptide (TPR) repeat protein
MSITNYQRLSFLLAAAYVICSTICGAIPGVEQDEIDRPVTPLCKKGCSYSEQGQLEKAIGEFTQSIQLDPRNSVLYYFRAMEYLILKQYSLAIKDLNKAISLNSQEGKFFLIRGIAFEEQGQESKAAKDFDHAFQLSHGAGCWELNAVRKKINTMRRWSVNGYTCQPILNGLEIIKKNKVLFTTAGKEDWDLISLMMPLRGAKRLPFPQCWDFSDLKPNAKSTAILMEKSSPPMFVIEHDTSSPHYPAQYEFLSLGPKFKKIAMIDESNAAQSRSFEFIDFRGDGCCAAVGDDGTFLYWNACFAESPTGTIILRLENGKFELAEELMKCKLPDTQYLSRLVKQTRANIRAEKLDRGWNGENFEARVPPVVWSNMIKLIYSGNGNAAWQYLNQQWPRGKHALDWGESKADFLADFKEQLAKSPYWKGLRHLNGWDGK